MSPEPSNSQVGLKAPDPASGPLAGIRVVEVASWVAGPAASQLLRGLGASVVKVEPPGGDGLRDVSNPARVPGINPPFELSNRGKTGVALDLRDPSDLERLHRLLESADVFITNLSHRALGAAGISHDRLHERYPSLVYCLISGYGSTAPERDRPGFDGAAYWAASGLGILMSDSGAAPPTPRAAIGDHATALAATGGICAALLGRERGGKGQFLDVSLRNTAAYTLGWDFSNLEWVGRAPQQPVRETASNALNNYYRLADDSWIALVNVNSDKAWPGLCHALELESILEDGRFRTRRDRAANAATLVKLLEEAFSHETLDSLAPKLDANGQVWSPLVRPEQLLARDDLEGVLWEAATVNGARRRIPISPLGFGPRMSSQSESAPGIGEHNGDAFRLAALATPPSQERS